MNKLFAAMALCIALASHAQQPTESGVVRTAYTYHILLGTEAEAKALRAEISRAKPDDQFATFKEVAKRSSIDPSSKQIGGNLDWVFEGEMVRTFENAVFASKPNEVNGPFKSEFGWHLTYVTEFRSLSVSGICRPAIAEAHRSADGQWKVGLELAMKPFSSSVLPEQVRQLLGPEWSGPINDPRGNLIFFRIRTGSDPASREVTQHVELVEGLLEVTARPKGCSHSARMVWSIRCADKRVAFVSRSTFEGRGALGRVLATTLTDQSKAEFQPISEGTFASQIYQLACGDRLRLNPSVKATAYGRALP